jgi:hypothetical protein
MKAMTAAILTILVAANLSLLPAQEQTPHRSSAAVEAPPNSGAANNDNTAADSGAMGAVVPGVNPGCTGCGPSCHPQGCLLRKLWIWATYCPKERVCSCTSCCNSCQYKGVLPIYLLFLNPKCFEGSGVHPTVPNECYRGCGCATGTACRHP